jgi:hypothetical protein
MRKLDRVAVAVRVLCLVLVWKVGAPVQVFAQKEADSPGYRNLQVLPADTTSAQMSEAMLTNLLELGLPRRGNEGCLFCHAGSMDVPRSDGDYASDEKPQKGNARVMMAMVRDINEGHLSKLSDRSSPEVAVTCYSCHAGRINPMPLAARLERDYRSGGFEALEATFRAAHERYYEADAYDFRVSTLMAVAGRLVALGKLDDAARVHELNVEFYDDVRAAAGLIQLRMFQALGAEGIDAMVERYHALKDEHPPEVFRPQLIDPLAWQLFRSGQQDAGFRLFELNYAEHPDAFVANEDLAYGLKAIGEEARAIELAERWVAEHPDHEVGRRFLAEIKGGG